ncbi:TPA: hypothetical protein ACS3BS_001050 [Klebsiella michiganensis]
MTITETQKTAQLAADAAVSAAEAKQYMLEAEQGYQDTSAAAQQAQDAAGSALLSKQSAATSEENSLQYATEAGVARDEAVASASTAAEFGDNKLTFADTTAGLAGTTSGQYFRVPQGVGNILSFRYYKNNAGAAVEVAEYVGQGSISNSVREYLSLTTAQSDVSAGNILSGGYCWVRNTVDTTLADEYINNSGTLEATGRVMPSQKAVQQLTDSFGLVGSQPNLFDNAVTDQKSLPPIVTSFGSLPEISTYNGLPCFSVKTVENSATESGSVFGGFKSELLPSGKISAYCLIVHVDGSMGVASARAILMQFNSSGSEITSARVEKLITNSQELTDLTPVSFVGVAKDPLCASVGLFIGLTPDPASAVRSMHFKDLMICDGENPVFRRIPSAAAFLDSAISGVNNTDFLTPAIETVANDQKMLGLQASNFITTPTFEEFIDGSTPTGWTNATVMTLNGVKCLRTPAATSATATDSPRMPVSQYAGKHISVSMDIYQKTGDQGLNSGGLNNLRARVAALDSSGTLINDAWTGIAGNDDSTTIGNQYYTRNIPRSSITEPYRLSICRNIKLPSTAAYIVINIRSENNGATAAPYVYATNFVGVNAPDAVMHPEKLNRVATFSGGNTTSWLTEAGAAQVAKSKDFWNVLPNWFTDSQLQNASVGDVVPGWDQPLVAVLKSGILTLEVPKANLTTAAGYNLLPGFSVTTSKFPSGNFSAALDIMEKIGDQGVNASGQNNLRVRVWARDASGQLINTAWAGVTGNDDTGSTGAQYYTRYVPRASITSRTRLVIAENIPVPAGAAYLIFNIRAEGVTGAPCPQMYPTNWVLRDGADPSWCQEKLSTSATVRTSVFLSPTGSDANTGTSPTSALKTLSAAITRINGFGTVYLSPGRYAYSDINAPFSGVTRVSIEGITDSAFNYPLIVGGSLLSGISKLSGYTRIYSAPLTGFATGTHPSWLWIDGLPDADTLETPEFYHPVMRGRPNRLECTKIWLADTVRTAINRDTPVSWSKTAALTEMDASNSPRCAWVESEGVVYFTMPNGGDPTLSGVAIYAAPTVQSIFTGSETQFTGKGAISITGIRVRYASIAVTGFRETLLNDVGVLGAAENCFDIGNWTVAYNCKAAGSGSRSFVGTYDGYNAHNFSVFTHFGCWATDCLDDGWSSHENCTEAGYAPVSWFNLGSGLTPAYGAEAMYVQPYTRSNALQTRKVNAKAGGIEAHQSPISSDPGVATVVTVYDGISVGDNNGYVSGDTLNTPAAANLIAYNCKAIDPVQFGFRCTKIVDCRHSGTGTANSGTTKQTIATTLITS